jgi:hypothetical protein
MKTFAGFIMCRIHFDMPSNQGSKLKLGTIQSFISPTNAQLIRFKILKFTLKYTLNLKQIYCAIVGLIKVWITSKCTVQM